MSEPLPDPSRVELARRAIGLIDLTDLADDHAPDGIDPLCARAAEHRTAAVCVWPEFVATCAGQLRGSGVRVATVVNFPTGDEPVAEVVAATRQALADGADDIDLVLPYRALLAGDLDETRAMVAAVRAAVDAPGAVLKVILETGALGDAATVEAAARLAVDGGADFVKTSTGKIPAGASLDAAAAMLSVIRAAAAEGRAIGLKPSGGIRTLEDARSYLDLADDVMGPDWATPATFRFGASGLLDALLAEVTGAGVTGTASEPPGSSSY